MLEVVSYPIGLFQKASAPAASAAANAPAPLEATRIGDVKELDQWGVEDRIKVIIVQGHDPENPKEDDNSRSIWLYDALCHLFRKNVPDDIVYGLITDSRYGISASVLDKGSNVHKYAIRQME